MTLKVRNLALFSILVAAVPAMAAPVPTIGTPVEFVDGLNGPEGIAFTRRRQMVVGSTTGAIVQIDRFGNKSVLAETGDPLAGVTVLRDGRVLATSFSGRIWAVDPKTGILEVFAEGIAGPNFVVETRRRRVWVSASLGGAIVDITDPVPEDKATGLSFPNGMAIGKEFGQRYLYVAELVLSRISRLPILKDESLGPLEVYATGIFAPDGIAFDRRGNLLVVGGAGLSVVRRGTRDVEPLLGLGAGEFFSNLAFGRGGGFRRRDFYLVNFGDELGNGTTVVRVPYNIPGAPLRR